MVIVDPLNLHLKFAKILATKIIWSKITKLPISVGLSQLYSHSEVYMLHIPAHMLHIP